jgi:hypothetical protein
MDGTLEVRQILQHVLESKGDREPFSDDDSLLTNGRLASIDVIAVVLALEDRSERIFLCGPSTRTSLTA